MKTRTVLLLGVILSFHYCIPLGALELQSPNQRLAIEIPRFSEAKISGYQISRDGQIVLTGKFNLLTSAHDNLFASAQFQEHLYHSIDTAYVQPGGKQNPIIDHYNALSIQLIHSNKKTPHLTIECRAYNDGIAFRYTIHKSPDNTELQKLTINNEATSFRPKGEITAWPLYLPNYTTSHEGKYEQSPFERLHQNSLIATPLLLEIKNGPAIAITEAALHGYPGMYLSASKDRASTVVTSNLSPLPDRPNEKAHVQLPFSTPWRVIMMADNAGSLLESNLVLNLNPASTIKDTSWLRFGKTTWNWWNGFYPEPVGFDIGANYATIKHYIDFCADHGIDFHAIDCADENLTWYQQSAPGFAPSPDADILKPRPEIEFFRALDYAKARKVGIRLWVHWEPLSSRLEDAFAQYAEWGVEGLMVDFLDRDDQEMIDWSEKVLKVAAEHHLRIQFHGAWKPTGRRRTYPNLVNHEGSLNLEYLKWSEDCTPEHNLIVPFTRMLAGPMDYHLGGFLNVLPDAFEARSAHPMVLGTRCHHLAMYVAYENAVPMVCDAPTAYINQPGFDFIQQVPTEWDETRFLAGEVSDFLVIARRKGQDWYIAAMTDSS
ncbi:glycoside hydrolase family 97 protein, partial [bacterium]|nr:glycoside hydrolase family 97 protein [bacterium]